MLILKRFQKQFFFIIIGLFLATGYLYLHHAEKILMRGFALMDKLSFATAIGSVSGLLVFLATLLLVIKGGPVVGPNLQLLAQYFVGYTATVQGAFIAFGYSFCWGFLFGWLYAYLRNLFLSYYIYRIKKRAELRSFKDFMDRL